MKKIFVGLALILIAAGVSSTLRAAPQVWKQMYGVNLSGGESKPQGRSLPGVYSTDYIYPSQAELDYYKAKGITFIRLPFLWERVQHTLNGTLDSAELARLNTVVGYAAANGMKVLLDLHNYNAYTISGTSYKVGTTQVPVSALQNVWGQLAAHFNASTTVYGYDIMNEPSISVLADWQSEAQSVVDTIRQNDTNHFIFIEGLNSSGAQSWTTYNSALNITDPANMIVYSPHSYWGGNHSDKFGADEQGSSDIGPSQVQGFVTWLAGRPGAHGHIGEFGVPNNSNNYLPSWQAALDGFLSYAGANNLCTTYWAGGLRWGTYSLSCEPTSNFTVDSMQMAVLQKYNNNGGLPPVPYGWQNQDIGSVAAAGSSSCSDGTFTIKGSGANIIGSADAFQFAYTQATGDCTIVARIVSQSNSNANAKSGVMIREMTAAGSSFVMMFAEPTGSSTLLNHYRTTTNGGAASNGSTIQALPYWISVRRVGNTFGTYRSPDGITWTQVGASVTSTMASTVCVGLGVCSHSDGVLCTTVFDNVRVTQGSLPAGWDSQDVGTVIAPGSSNASGGTYTISGSGANIATTADGFQYASKPVSGNCTVTARILSQSNPNQYARSGVMIRETKDAGGTYEMMCVQPGGHFFEQHRSTTNANGSASASVTQTLPYWIRSVRSGNSFSSYYSPNGTTWTQVGTTQTIAMATSVYAGLAVNSHADGELGTTTFDNVTITTP